MTVPVSDYEGFLAWLGRGAERAPHLYGGKIAHSVVPVVSEPRRPPSVAMAVVPEATADFKSAAAGSEVEVEWDGYQEDGHGPDEQG